MKDIRQLAMIAVGSMVVALLASCGAGYAIARAGGSEAVLAARDVGIILLAIFSLVPTLIAAGAYFGLAFVIGRWGGKLIVAVRWLAQKEATGERLVNNMLDNVVVRPVAKTARMLTASKEFVVASVGAGDRAGGLDQRSQHAVRTVTSLWRQLRGNPMGQANH